MVSIVKYSSRSLRLIKCQISHLYRTLPFIMRNFFNVILILLLHTFPKVTFLSKKFWQNYYFRNIWTFAPKSELLCKMEFLGKKNDGLRQCVKVGMELGILEKNNILTQCATYLYFFCFFFPALAQPQDLIACLFGGSHCVDLRGHRICLGQFGGDQYP